MLLYNINVAILSKFWIFDTVCQAERTSSVLFYGQKIVKVQSDKRQDKAQNKPHSKITWILPSILINPIDSQ